MTASRRIDRLRAKDYFVREHREKLWGCPLTVCIAAKCEDAGQPFIFGVSDMTGW
jgi:hypothetical protein